MATLITIAVGSSVGLVCRRFAAAHPLGAFTDMLLGITGAFAGRWFVDVLRQIGVNFESYSWTLVLCGACFAAVGLPWLSGFRVHTFHGRTRTYSERKMASQQVDSRKNDVPAA